jgi:L-ascorbate metabolism protein UlaG (beta-lactamase superfamily)
MNYPVSDHYDGSVFFNPEPSTRTAPPATGAARSPEGKRMTAFSFIRARLSRDPAIWNKWPDRIENKRYPAPVGLVPADTAAISFIGHSSFLVRLPGLNVLTDPVFSERCSPFSFLGPRRVRDPGIALASLPQIDLTILSHNHYDHMDLASLRKLRRRFPKMRIIAPLGNAAYLAKKSLPGAEELDWWQSTSFGDTSVTATPARHFAARWLNDRNQTLWAGFLLEHLGAKIYFAGDTGYTKFFAEIRQRLGAPDIALLPIGAYEPRLFMQVVHMNPADAVQAFTELEPRQAVGMHFGTFQLTAEAIDQPEKDLIIAKSAANIPNGSFITLDCGETRQFQTGRVKQPLF